MNGKHFISKILIFVKDVKKNDEKLLTQRNTFSFIRRKMFLEKITDENKEIFQRLENQKTHYSVKFFQEERKKKEKILQTISKYPYAQSFHFPSETKKKEIKEVNKHL